MTERRYHRDVVAAAAIGLGAQGFIIGVLMSIVPSAGTAGLVGSTAIAASIGGWIARSVMPDLELGETAVATAASLGVMVGLERIQQAGTTFDLEVSLLPLIAAMVGSVAGVWAAGRFATRRWPSLAVGLGSFGVSFVAVAISIAATWSDGGRGAMLSIGFVVGIAAMLHLVPELKTRHAIIGPALVMGGLGVVVAFDGEAGWGQRVGSAAGGLAIGALVGAAVGLIGWIVAWPLLHVRDRARHAAPIPVAYARPTDDDPDRGGADR